MLRVIPVTDRGEIMLEEYQTLLGPRTRLVALDPCLEQPGHDPAGRGNDADGQTLRCPRADRRRSVGRPSAGQRAATGLRLLCLFRTQDLRPDGHRRGVRQGRTAGNHAALAGRRQHDQERDVRGDHVRRAAGQIRGRHSQRRRCGGPGSGTGLCQPVGTAQHRQVRTGTAAVRDGTAVPHRRAAADRNGPRESGRPVVRAARTGRPRKSAGCWISRASPCVPAIIVPQPSLRRFGLEATVRPSLSFYNTTDEIDRLADAVRRIRQV